MFNFLIYLIFLFWSSVWRLGCNNICFEFGIKFENDVNKIGECKLKLIIFFVLSKYSGSLFILLLKLLFFI